MFLLLLWLLEGMLADKVGGMISVACRLVPATVLRMLTVLAVDLNSELKESAFKRVARCLSIDMDPFSAGQLKHLQK